MLEENEDTIYKLNSMSETISEIAKSYNEAAATVVEDDVENKEKEIFLEEFLNNISQNSNNMLYDDIINVDTGIASDIYEKTLKKEELFMQDIIDVFEAHNAYIMGLEDEVLGKRLQKDLKYIAKIANEASKISKVNFVWNQKQKESKKQMGKSLNDVSKAISEVAENLESKANSPEIENLKEEIEILLMQKNIGIYEISINKEQTGKIFLSITINKNDNILDETTKLLKIEEILEKALKEKLTLKSQKNTENRTILNYVSQDKLKLEIGIAKETKDGSEISGDSSIKLKLADGKMLIGLSDGMGSGKAAQVASKTTIDIIKKLFGSGFQSKTALNLVNQAITAKTQGESFATVDISVFDLYEKNVEIIKSGSPATYLKREKEVHTIKGNSIPAGMLPQADNIIFDKDIKDGDIFVMCTDGVLDANIEALNKEEALKNLIQNISVNKAQKMADLILTEAIDWGFGSKKDDMTVVVIKCVNNQ